MEYNIYPDSFNYERDLERNEQIGGHRAGRE